jgi:hypothetical protein
VRRTLLATGVALVTSYAALQILGRIAGSTARERRSTLPGDDLVGAPQLVTNHGVTIQTTPDQIWPWLTQMGWHRGGYYTPAWVDRLLFPSNWPSADQLDATLLRSLAPGDSIPDGPPGTAEYVVSQVVEPRTLVLRSTSHVPPGWHERYDATIVWTWCFSLTATDEGTRVHLRVRGRMTPWWFAALYVATIVPADYVMAGGMLRGLKARAEAVRPAGG